MLVAMLAIASLVLWAGAAQARTETIRWSQPNSANVTGWKIYVGLGSRAYDTIIDAGSPTSNGAGEYSFNITADDDATIYVAMTSYNSERAESALSNERVRSVGGTDPVPAPDPDPTPPPSGGGGSSPPGDLSEGTEIPPNANALVRFDFDSGSAPNWFDTGANNSMSQNDSLFTVVSVGSNPALSTQANATNFHSHFVGSPSNLSNIVLTGRMAIESISGGVGVTAYSGYPTEDVYYRLRTEGDNNSFELAGHPNGTSCAGSTDTRVVAQAGEWYEFEMTIQNLPSGNQISASVWKQGDSKPGSPQVQCTDSSSNRPLTGAVGVWSMGAGGRYWDDLEVRSISGTTPTPTGPPEPPVLISIDAVQ